MFDCDADTSEWLSVGFSGLVAFFFFILVLLLIKQMSEERHGHSARVDIALCQGCCSTVLCFVNMLAKIEFE